MGHAAEQLNALVANAEPGTRMRFEEEGLTLPDANGFSGTPTVLLVPDVAANDLAFVWQKLKPAAAALVMPPESRAAVEVDSARLEAAPFRDVAAPIWELIVRLAGSGESIAVLAEGEIQADELLPLDSGLPHIAPNWPPRKSGWLFERLQQFRPDETANDPVALHSGLWLIHDFLDESHELSQSIQGRGSDRNGDYWHGIMHRREPDWGNSKYWFRRVGDHPVFFDLAGIAGRLLKSSGLAEADQWSRSLASSSWDPFAFVDLCESAARDPGSELASVTRRIQWTEILLLLAHCS
ncbi:MAG: hypothetical protein ACYTGL_21585 [Planctomycetota bacterium]|jgi:hypothetical protein